MCGGECRSRPPDPDRHQCSRCGGGGRASGTLPLHIGLWQGIGPCIAPCGVSAPAGGIVPAVAPAGGVGVDGDEDDVAGAEGLADSVYAAAAF